MRILAIDTTGDWGGAAIFQDDACLASVGQQGFQNYSVTLFESVNSVLAAARLNLNEIDLFAAANGPGSFTGIRVGLAAVQGWARAFSKPARGVSILEAMAETAAAPLTLSILDARRGEFYARLFRLQDDGSNDAPGSRGAQRLAPLSEGVILKPEGVLPFLHSQGYQEGDCTGVARENDLHACALAQSLADILRWRIVSASLFPAIARLAAASAGEKIAPLPEDLTAYYIRRPDAEINWKQ
ncbi:MAG: tRNA (adenosine(37)-N6)-threonylcarbamoyltransferase complex dimerization subunit type 1 TsaB [Acidobacteriota bacterium]|nr:tRNA (adenosine(37)-N6)-threonylcarbamoyltransferase complex dimerization subunit type 1 TsaB [Acidobacteriota bacterium]